MKLKKLISLGLAIVMLGSVLAGCGAKEKTSYQDDENEKVTLTMMVPFAETRDADKVLAVVNEKLEELLPNTELDIIFEANAPEKWTIWMSTRKSIDLVNLYYKIDLSEQVRKKSIIELDGLVEEYAPTLQEHRDKYWSAYESGTVGESLYAIPNVQYSVNNIGAMSLGEAANYIDMEAFIQEGWTHDTTTERFWQLIDEGFDRATAAGVDMSGTIGTTWLAVAQKGYHIVEETNIAWKDSSEKIELIDFYTTDEFKVYCDYMKKWADKGYVSPDVLVDEGNALQMKPLDGILLDYDTGKIAHQGSGTDPNYYAFRDPNKQVIKTGVGSMGTYWSIPYTSEHPARAIKLVDLLHSEKGAEIVNLLAYGIEGEHYEFVNKEKGEIKAFDYEAQGTANSAYSIPNWMVSNMLQGMYTIYPHNNAYLENAKEYYESIEDMKDSYLSVQFDLSEVQVEINNILRNNAEIAPNIYSGVVDGQEENLKTLLAKNEAAGFSKVVEHLQKQADEYVKSR